MNGAGYRQEMVTQHSTSASPETQRLWDSGLLSPPEDVIKNVTFTESSLHRRQPVPKPAAKRGPVPLLFSVRFCLGSSAAAKQILCPVEEGVRGMMPFILNNPQKVKGSCMFRVIS